MIANLLDACRRREAILASIHAEARAGHDQLIDVSGLKMFEQRWHVEVEPVSLQVVRFDQFVVVGQAAHVHARLHARIECGKPPRFG